MKRDKLLPQIRVSQEELRVIHNTARLLGLTVSEYVRFSVTNLHNVNPPVRSSFCDKIAKWFGR